MAEALPFDDGGGAVDAAGEVVVGHGAEKVNFGGGPGSNEGGRDAEFPAAERDGACRAAGEFGDWASGTLPSMASCSGFQRGSVMAGMPRTWRCAWTDSKVRFRRLAMRWSVSVPRSLSSRLVQRRLGLSMDGMPKRFRCD